MSGKLFLVATPIGNLEDMTFRAVRTLQEADLIAAEDTRGTIKLLNHFDIHTPMTSYHEYNRIEKAHHLTQRMLAGENVALVTDAGMPGISDPGEDLVRIAREAGVEVTVLPGACAAVTALPGSALPTRRFCFEAFLPADKKERQKILLELKEETRTIVLYEAPHRLEKTLRELKDALGERRVALCRELTKLHETYELTTLGQALKACAEKPPRGEYVLVIEGVDTASLEERERASWEELSVREHVGLYLAQGFDRKEAMKMAAKDRGVGKREIYQALVDTDEDSNPAQS